ncbi:hypothetical protein [Lentilactobacillus kosonis]|uniref:Uncharacterized protein n=1 Tax=Lentilactobacillus kosonis TaxID=2810561 RepID=A0A401FI35_9LACO|nr:hypothetical protein [Lentilactobacillus kosonis]GAY71958.1 hypothetical protein NBRC111893_104 [Lentilactobacillus kosonis]
MNPKSERTLSKIKRKEDRDMFVNQELICEVPLYIKFVDKKYAYNFLNGELHFGKMQEYRDTALPGVIGPANTSIGDLNEDVHLVSGGENSKIHFYRGGVEEAVSFLKKGEFFNFRAVVHPDASAFCFTAVHRCELINDGNGGYHIRPEFIKKLENQFPPAEKVPFVILDPNFLWNMISLRARKIGIGCARAPICYCSDQNIGIRIQMDIFSNKVSPMNVVPFVKGLAYKDQSEYRFFLEDSSLLNSKNNLIVDSLQGKVTQVSDLSEVEVKQLSGTREISSDELFQNLEHHFWDDYSI